MPIGRQHSRESIAYLLANSLHLWCGLEIHRWDHLSLKQSTGRIEVAVALTLLLAPFLRPASEYHKGNLLVDLFEGNL